MNEICNICGTAIKENKCSCGIWEEDKSYMRLALEEFHEMNKFTCTADMPHLGCAVVFFRGDYLDCKEVQNFIHKIKNRPYNGPKQ